MDITFKSQANKIRGTYWIYVENSDYSFDSDKFLQNFTKIKKEKAGVDDII